MRRPRASDVVIAGALFLLGAFAIFLAYDLTPDDVKTDLPRWGSYAAMSVVALPLVFRRVAPLTSGAFVGLAFMAFRLLQVPEASMSSIALFIALYSMGAFGGDRTRRDVARASVIVGGLLTLVISIFSREEVVSLDGITFVVFSLVLNMAFFVAAWMLGDASRARAENELELQRRADELAAEREARAREAVIDERVRIARELHDVVAHHVSVMGVQAAAARRMLERDTTKAGAALEHVEDSGRNAIGELQRLVGYLRADSEGDPIAGPQPTLAELPGLIEDTRAIGLPIEYRQIGRARPLPSSVELSAFRIVQEALTNVVRHAPGATTTVVLTHMRDALGVEVVNGPAAPGATRSGPGGGRGLLGMRERTAVLDGTFEHGPTGHGGYRIAARLPSLTSYESDTVAAQ